MRRQLVTVVNQIFGPKAAREQYFKLGLDTVPAMFEPTAAPEFQFTYTAVRIDPPKDEAAA